MARRFESPRQIIDVSLPVFGNRTKRRVFFHPIVRYELDNSSYYVFTDGCCHCRIRCFEPAREGKQDVFFDQTKRIPAALVYVSPRVMEVQRGAVIDHPETA